MNHALLQLAWDADGSGPPPSSPATDTAFWAAHAQRRVDVLAERIASRTAIAVHFPPALRMPTSLDVCDVTGAPTGEDQMQADIDRRDLWRLALDVRDTRGPITPGLMCLLLWAAHDGTPEGMPRLRPLEIRALRAWESVSGPVAQVVLVLAAGVGHLTTLAELRALAVAGLDYIGTETWAAVECELYDAAVAAGLVPRVWRRTPIAIPIRLDGELSRPWPR